MVNGNWKLKNRLTLWSSIEERYHLEWEKAREASPVKGAVTDERDNGHNFFGQSKGSFDRLWQKGTQTVKGIIIQAFCINYTMELKRIPIAEFDFCIIMFCIIMYNV